MKELIKAGVKAMNFWYLPFILAFAILAVVFVDMLAQLYDSSLNLLIHVLGVGVAFFGFGYTLGLSLRSNNEQETKRSSTRNNRPTVQDSGSVRGFLAKQAERSSGSNPSRGRVVRTGRNPHSRSADHQPSGAGGTGGLPDAQASDGRNQGE